MALTISQITKATEWNPIYARSLGWQTRYVDVLEKLGFPSTCPTGEIFAQAVANWQALHPPLEPDGMIGPNTWKKLEPELGKTPGSGPTPPTPPMGTGPRWLQYAQSESNRWATMTASLDKKKSGKAEMYVDWDEMYFQASPYYGGKPHADGAIPGTKNLDWCAAFANWCLHRAGYSHTGSAGAGSFLKDRYWRFDALEEPRQGCVVVPNNGAHVTFLWSWRER